MLALLNLFLDIGLLRKGPQDVPASKILLKICLLGYVFSSLLVLWSTTPIGVALLQVLLDLALLSGLLYLGLYLSRHPERFEQTFTALTGTGTLLGLLALPLMIGIGPQGSGDGKALLSWVLLMLMAWSIIIMAHIVRHAFQTPMGVGVLYALGYTFLSLTLTGWLNPLPS